jgi:hypothetical protein
LKTGQRKVPLLIHIAPSYFVALNYTCRYCHKCDLLLAHKHEIEHLLHELFSHVAPQVVGNDYLIVGSVEARAWRGNLNHPKKPAEILPHTHDFKCHYAELRFTMGGWFLEGQQAPMAKPPMSQEWVKSAHPV